METNIKEWILIDPSSHQYGRQLSEKVFEFKEDNCLFDVNDDNSDDRIIELTINLDHYSIDQIYDLCSPYYSKDHLNWMFFVDKDYWIIAECIFEQESGLY